jgi:hypothetical protein
MVALHVKADPSYVPVKDPGSRRWHALTTRGEFEILTTGPKWYDTRAKKGGGGAIDLVMHVLGLSFVEAVEVLTKIDSQQFLAPGSQRHNAQGRNELGLRSDTPDLCVDGKFAG